MIADGAEHVFIGIIISDKNEKVLVSKAGYQILNRNTLITTEATKLDTAVKPSDFQGVSFGDRGPLFRNPFFPRNGGCRRQAAGMQSQAGHFYLQKVRGTFIDGNVLSRCESMRLRGVWLVILDLDTRALGLETVITDQDKVLFLQ